MKKIFYYTTTALVLSCGITQAQTCVPTPTCSSLGYTSSSNCTNGIKCPFGEAWYCPSGSSQEISNLCLEMGYEYTCKETGYTGGVGRTCNSKYTECTCAEGYIWENGKCIKTAKFGQCNGYAVNCSLGYILFSDATCSANMVSGKIPIAVVVYKSGSCGQAMALDSIGKELWARDGYDYDISTLTNYSSAYTASKDYDSCGNTAKIIAEGSYSKFPAAWAAHEYKTEGTEAGDWCLPAAGIFTSIYNKHDTINTGFERAGGKEFWPEQLNEAWSSSEAEDYYAWVGDFDDSYGLNPSLRSTNNSKASSPNTVRPVIEFQFIVKK